jgi:uncharacterized short protein YbdD (DUF466 family)
VTAPEARDEARVGPAVGRALWYLREVMGENAYEHYLDHRRRTHPGEPVLPRGEFERRRMHELDDHPRARCC